MKLRGICSVPLISCVLRLIFVALLAFYKEPALRDTFAMVITNSSRIADKLIRVRNFFSEQKKDAEGTGTGSSRIEIWMTFRRLLLKFRRLLDVF